MARPENIVAVKQVTFSYPSAHHDMFEDLVKSWAIGSSRNVSEGVAYVLSELCNHGEVKLPSGVRGLIQRELRKRAATVLKK